MSHAPLRLSELSAGHGYQVLHQSAGLAVTQTQDLACRQLWFIRDNGDAVLQGSLNIHEPAKPDLAYIAHMMQGFDAHLAKHNTSPHSVWMLGLGCGSIAHAIKARVPHATIVAVDISQAVIDLAQQWFNWRVSQPDWRTVCANASSWLASQMDHLKQYPYDAPHLIAVDVYGSNGLSPALGLNGEYSLLAKLIDAKGCVAVNLQEQHAFSDHLLALNHAFEGRVHVRYVKGEGNPVAFAYGKLG